MCYFKVFSEKNPLIKNKSWNDIKENWWDNGNIPGGAIPSSSASVDTEGRPIPKTSSQKLGRFRTVPKILPGFYLKICLETYLELGESLGPEALWARWRPEATAGWSTWPLCQCPQNQESTSDCSWQQGRQTLSHQSGQSSENVWRPPPLHFKWDIRISLLSSFWLVKVIGGNEWRPLNAKAVVCGWLSGKFS